MAFDPEKLKERARRKPLQKSSLSLDEVKHALNLATFESYQSIMKLWRRQYDVQAS